MRDVNMPSDDNQSDDWALALDQFAHDVKTSKRKDDILVQLNNISSRLIENLDQEELDHEIKNGVALSLARCLHHRLLIRPLMNNTKYIARLDSTRTRQVMALCSAIDRLLRSSELPVVDYGVGFQKALASSLPRVVTLLVYANGDWTATLVTVSNCIRMMRRMLKASPHSPGEFIEALLVLLDVDLPMPSDILVDASSAIAEFVERVDRGDSILIQVKEKTNKLFTILCTAAAAAESSCQCEEVFDAILQMANVSEIATSLAQRICVVVVTMKRLEHPSSKVMMKVVALIRLLFSNYEVGGAKSTLCVGDLNLTIDALTMAACKESSAKVKLSMISTLSEIIGRSGLAKKQTATIMRCFLEIVATDGADGPVIEASIAYLQVAGKQSSSEEVLSNIVQFTTSPYAKVRAKSLWLLKDLCSLNVGATTTILLEKTDMQESFGLIISHGSESDCLDVLHICKLLVLQNGHQRLCKCSAILKALISFVTSEAAGKRAAYLVGVELVMELMSYDENIQFFLVFNDILPWLVNIANRTTDEEMKSRVVSTVICFSTALLAADQASTEHS